MSLFTLYDIYYLQIYLVVVFVPRHYVVHCWSPIATLRCPVVRPLNAGLIRPVRGSICSLSLLLTLSRAHAYPKTTNDARKQTKNIKAERLWFISLWLPLSIVVLLGSFFPLVPVSASRHHHLPATIAPSSNNPLSNAHAGTCAVLVGIGISEFVTQSAKFYVGRLRPNFYAMCGFDASSLRCTNGIEMETEARLSFPSGHSSLSFAGSVCLVLFLLGRCGLGRSDRRHSFGGGGRSGGGGNEGVAMASGRRRMAFAASFAPLLLSFWCATSRLVGELRGGDGGGVAVRPRERIFRCRA